MSRDFRHGLKQAAKSPRVWKDDEPPKDLKRPTKQQRETALRHAVRHRDLEAFEDYDESDG